VLPGHQEREVLPIGRNFESGFLRVPEEILHWYQSHFFPWGLGLFATPDHNDKHPSQPQAKQPFDGHEDFSKTKIR
jgi:hypothetical protein